MDQPACPPQFPLRRAGSAPPADRILDTTRPGRDASRCLGSNRELMIGPIGTDPHAPFTKPISAR
jgi:hypothetical protein